MVRCGINKALATNSCEAILAKKQNPSIDAVPVELGNMSSKSTIYRYLKEWEVEASTQLDDEALPIKESLASGLRKEAYKVVEENRQRYET